MINRIVIWAKDKSRGKVLTFVKESTREFFTDNCHHLAASMSFFLLFSLFPLTLAALSLMGYLFEQSTLETLIIEGISELLPISSEFITATIQGVISLRGLTGIIALIMLFLGGSGFFNATRKSLNTAWGIRTPHPFYLARLLEIGMMTASALLLLASVSLTAGLRIVRGRSLPIIGSPFLENDASVQFVVIVAGIALAFIVFVFLYKFVPNTQVRWRDVWVGALAAAIGFEILKVGFIWFIDNFSAYHIVYGSIGTIIALLVWTYISAFIMLYCAKLTAVNSRQKASFTSYLTRKSRINKVIVANSTTKEL
jgi:membrane protein